ncbi:hypothetical protein [Actinosynnema sp. NPDC023587]|uniref:hypothetical protein n=1 Tax=Actinosynnema sp. NPDC023587 TaxID=3154695 RepID=UPI0033EEE5BE
MKRSALPKRTAPLRRGTPLRRTPFPNRGPARRAQIAPAAGKKLVRLRPGLGGLCEVRSPWCQGRGTQFSHRWHQGQGGPWTASNGVRACGLGNAAGCHGWIHQRPVEAEKLGLIVRPGPGGKADTTLIPVKIHTVQYGYAWVFLDDKGGVVPDTTPRVP